MVACNSSTAVLSSVECGCGVGLERCMPGGSTGFDPPAFTIPRSHPIGVESPTEVGDEAQSSWSRLWWGEEAQRYIDSLLLVEDRRLSRDPHRQGHGHQRATRPFLPRASPLELLRQRLRLRLLPARSLVRSRQSARGFLGVHDTAKWVRVEDRGAHASGLLTMPIFLTKFGSRRGRAHVLYSTFLCREFVAGDVKLEPSTEPNLMKRSGCNTCHVALEPLSAYFSRVKSPTGRTCRSELSHQDDHQVPERRSDEDVGHVQKLLRPRVHRQDADLLRGAYASEENANAGPAGIAQYLVTSKEFPGCIAQKVSESFLGRPVSTDDMPVSSSSSSMRSKERLQDDRSGASTW